MDLDLIARLERWLGAARLRPFGAAGKPSGVHPLLARGSLPGIHETADALLVAACGHVALLRAANPRRQDVAASPPLVLIEAFI
jgi:hypothetical protein